VNRFTEFLKKMNAIMNAHINKLTQGI